MVLLARVPARGLEGAHAGVRGCSGWCVVTSAVVPHCIVGAVRFALDEGSLGSAAEARLGEAVDWIKPGCRLYSRAASTRLGSSCIEARKAAGPS